MQWALLEAAETGDTAALRRLLAAGADANAHGPFRQTPLHLAARHGHTEAAKELVAAGALLSERTTLGATALHESCGCWWGRRVGPAEGGGRAGEGRVALVRFLLAAGAEVDARDRHGATPLPRLLPRI
jgi:ankyrin repeat protein